VIADDAVVELGPIKRSFEGSALLAVTTDIAHFARDAIQARGERVRGLLEVGIDVSRDVRRHRGFPLHAAVELGAALGHFLERLCCRRTRKVGLGHLHRAAPLLGSRCVGERGREEPEQRGGDEREDDEGNQHLDEREAT